MTLPLGFVTLVVQMAGTALNACLNAQMSVAHAREQVVNVSHVLLEDGAISVNFYAVQTVMLPIIMESTWWFVTRIQVRAQRELVQWVTGALIVNEFVVPIVYRTAITTEFVHTREENVQLVVSQHFMVINVTLSVVLGVKTSYVPIIITLVTSAVRMVITEPHVLAPAVPIVLVKVSVMP